MLKKFMAFLAALYMVTAFAAVDANKATLAELDSVKGIGPGISAKIVDERKKGNFKDWPDLVNRVNGIGEINAKKFSDQGMTIGGASFSGMPAAAMPGKDSKKDAKKAEAKPVAAAPAAAPAAAAAAPVDAKAEAKMKADEAKAQKAAEKKAKAEEKKKLADDAKAAKAAAAAPAAKAAPAAAPAPKAAASAAKK